MVAWLDIRHVGPDALDDPGALVTDHSGHRARVDALQRVEVGVADPARDHAYEHLAGTRRVERKLLHDERLPVFVEHGGPHGRPPAVRAIWNEVRDICGFPSRAFTVRACGDLPVWTPLAPPAPDRATESDEDRPRAAGSRARRAPRVDPDARWRAPLGAALAAGELGRGTGAGDPRVHPVPQGRPLAARRRAAPPLLGRPWLRERARRPARQRRLRGRAPRRVPARRSRTTPRTCSRGSPSSPGAPGAWA